MSVTILGALQNANYNLDNLQKMPQLLFLVKAQLNNAVELLEKGYSIDDEVEPLLEQYGTMVSLSEQIAEFEAKGCVAGGRKWQRSYYSLNIRFWDRIDDYKLVVELSNSNPQVMIINIEKNKHNIYSATAVSTTLEEALIEALEIVKAKVVDLAKELGFVCFGKVQVKTIKYALVDALNYEYNNKFQVYTSNYKQLQQYIAEQGNE